MEELFAARLQMAFSLAFHMIFAALGVGLPVLALIAEGLWLRRRQPHYLELARTWARATGVVFAIGAVSGTAVAFQLGLLWPRFMERYGSTIGPAFTLESFAFFFEAIFLALYLYGWDRLRPWAHWTAGAGVALAAAASSILVTAANAWMQHPHPASGPLQALFANATWPVMALHGTLATYAATGFAVAGISAWGALRRRPPRPGETTAESRRREAAVGIALAVGVAAAVAMPLTGDLSARQVARQQPVKLAAMEAQFQTERGAPLRIGGWPDVARRQVRGAVEIPGGLSWLAFRDPQATVAGLDRVPVDRWPNVVVTHVAFQLMVAAGVAMLGTGAVVGYAAWRRRRTAQPLLAARPLAALVVGAAPLGFVALEAGWITAEVGRQPWIAYGLMQTAEALTPATGWLASTLFGFVALYCGLGAALIWFLRHPLRPAEAWQPARTGAPPATPPARPQPAAAEPLLEGGSSHGGR